MKKVSLFFAMIFAVSMAMGQTDLDLDQSATINTADIWQSNSGSKVTSTMIDQTAATSNDVTIEQLGNNSSIELTQGAGSLNDALIYQRGSRNNEFVVNQSADGDNNADLRLVGGDVHGNDWYVDQTATGGKNEVVITSLGDHVYSNGGIDIDQTAYAGNNKAVIDQDGDWRRHVDIKSEQTSDDNELDGYVRGQHVDVDIYQDGFLTNYAKFEVMGNDVTLDVDQMSTSGGNTLYSYQEANSTAIVNQNAVGGNYADVNQVNP